MNDLNRLAEAIRAYACEDYDADDDDLDEDEDFKEEVEELIFQAFIPVDAAHDELEIVLRVAEKVKATNQLEGERVDDQLWVTLNNERYQLPLTSSGCDQYVTLSSLAYLLKEQYDFWILQSDQASGSHLLLVANKSDSEEMKKNNPQIIPEPLRPMKLGHDYFLDIEIPYLHHENNNPNFENERDNIIKEGVRLRERKNEHMRDLFEGIRSGNIDAYRKKWHGR